MMPSPSRSAAMLPGTAPGGGGGGGAAAISSCCEQAESASAQSAPSMRGWIRINHYFWMQPEIAFRKREPHPEISARRELNHVFHPRDRGWFWNNDLSHNLTASEPRRW